MVGFLLVHLKYQAKGVHSFEKCSAYVSPSSGEWPRDSNQMFAPPST